MIILDGFKTFNFRLFIAIFITKLLPTIYLTVRWYFLGYIPTDWGFNIASQMQWLNLVYEIIQEMFIYPLYHLLGEALSDSKEFQNRVRGGLFVTFIVYSLVSVVVICATRPLLVLMAQQEELIDMSITYIRLETVGIIINSLWSFTILVFVTLRKDIYMYITLVIQVVLSIILDTFLVSDLRVSAHLGVNGIAVTNIVANFINLCVSLYLLHREGILKLNKNDFVPNFKWLLKWFNIGKYSGLESFCRNFAFMMMVIRMANSINQSGTYWVSNNFIWQYLLLPTLALSDLVKKEVAEDITNIRKKTCGYLLMSFVFIALWLISIPVWKPYMYYVINLPMYQDVYPVVLVQTGFYFSFIFNNAIMDSTFYGAGKTLYLLIQSICISVIYYGIMFILYKKDIFVPTLHSISLMFGFGILLDFIPTFVLYWRFLKKKQIMIDLTFREQDKQNDTLLKDLSDSSLSPPLSPALDPTQNTKSIVDFIDAIEIPNENGDDGNNVVINDNNEVMENRETNRDVKNIEDLDIE
ncbi:hypothetical protein CYY_006199 [Polysphondylium violaceum]|uniref:Multi antimicrobial extrusion family protein n=1 Tax=Polysphondylium violaceum TaxID=133409 RepID=A0A8J4PQZ3_9MYCE|nr:hypothetical protein CYY_006199 [Polysphondylium violaceum]